MERQGNNKMGTNELNDYSIRCDFCKKITNFKLTDEQENQDYIVVYCEHCGRAINAKFKGQEFYE